MASKKQLEARIERLEVDYEDRRKYGHDRWQSTCDFQQTVEDIESKYQRMERRFQKRLRFFKGYLDGLKASIRRENG